MAEIIKKLNTVKYVAKKVADNGDENDYSIVPIGTDSENVDRPDKRTVEESLVEIESGKAKVIPVETLPETDIKGYPFIYALVKPGEKKGTFYEYRNGEWIPYGNRTNGIWVGTKEECAEDFDNIETGTVVIIVKKKDDESGDAHDHDYVCFITKAPTYSETGVKTYTCFLCGDSYTEEIPALSDSISPAGVIRIGTREYSAWKDQVSFEIYTNQNQTVEIEGTDNETGIKEIAYHLAASGVNDTSIGTVTWTPYTAPFTIEPNNNYIVYARITDNADNVTYICSDGIVLDNIPPIFDGLEDGETYPTGTVLTVEEGAVLTVNGETVELVNNTYTFSEVMDNCLLTLTDRAGNVNEISVNISCIHNFSDGVCTICGRNEYEDYILGPDNYSMCGIVPEGDVSIPGIFEYNGQKYKTIGIAQGTFEQSPITSVDIPNGVKTIKDQAFWNCISLINVNVPSSVTDITGYAFAGCNNLENIYYNSNFVIGKFPGSLMSNENLTFTIGKNVENIDLLSSVKGINGTIIIEEGCGITTIPTGLFDSGSYFQNIVLPPTITSIEDSAFEMTSLKTITVPSIILGKHIFNKCSKLTSVIISNGISEIPEGTFNECSNLKSVSIPDTTIEIRNGAFCMCTSLEVNIPNNVAKIGNGAFYKVPHITYHGTATGAPWGALAIN